MERIHPASMSAIMPTVRIRMKCGTANVFGTILISKTPMKIFTLFIACGFIPLLNLIFILDLANNRIAYSRMWN